MDSRVAFPFVIQGSGWGWLGYNKATGKLQIATCPNQVSVTSAINITEVSLELTFFRQDPLEATTGLIPLFGIDVWEHAYYLQYKNVRPDYVKAIYQVIECFHASFPILYLILT